MSVHTCTGGQVVCGFEFALVCVWLWALMFSTTIGAIEDLLCLHQMITSPAAVIRSIIFDGGPVALKHSGELRLSTASVLVCLFRCQGSQGCACLSCGMQRLCNGVHKLMLVWCHACWLKWFNRAQQQRRSCYAAMLLCQHTVAS